jgi:nitrous oxide reductase accessory protein NosL
MDMTVRRFVESLPDTVRAQIIAESNDPVLESDEDLIAAIEQEPEQFASLIREHAPDWAAQMFDPQPPAPAELSHDEWLTRYYKPEPERGRPSLYGEAMAQTSIWLPRQQIEWLKARGMGETIRSLIKQAMGAGDDPA